MDIRKQRQLTGAKAGMGGNNGRVACVADTRTGVGLTAGKPNGIHTCLPGYKRPTPCTRSTIGSRPPSTVLGNQKKPNTTPRPPTPHTGI